MYAQLRNFWRDEDGATAIEYGLIVGLIAVVIIGSVSVLGGTLQGFFQTINAELTGADGAGEGGGEGGGGTT